MNRRRGREVKAIERPLESPAVETLGVVTIGLG